MDLILDYSGVNRVNLTWRRASEHKYLLEILNWFYS
jgi:hypothetical protein